MQTWSAEAGRKYARIEGSGTAQEEWRETRDRPQGQAGRESKERGKGRRVLGDSPTSALIPSPKSPPRQQSMKMKAGGAAF